MPFDETTWYLQVELNLDHLHIVECMNTLYYVGFYAKDKTQPRRWLVHGPILETPSQNFEYRSRLYHRVDGAGFLGRDNYIIAAVRQGSNVFLDWINIPEKQTISENVTNDCGNCKRINISIAPDDLGTLYLLLAWIEPPSDSIVLWSRKLTENNWYKRITHIENQNFTTSDMNMRFIQNLKNIAIGYSDGTNIIAGSGQLEGG